VQALILVGGEGTRLRPMTSTIPKPVVPLVDRPFVTYMLEWLRRHGVDDVVMSCGFLASGVRNVLGDGSGLGIRLRYVEEPRPLGTGGALKFAESLLDERFLMLNGDVLTDLDLGAQLEQHERTGARGTIALIPVEDPSGYGLVRLGRDNVVEEFLEKPSPDQIDTKLVNAGAYVLERDVLSMIPPEVNFSIERDVFTEMVGDGLYGCPGSGYWLDIGTPRRYLQATFDILERNVRTEIGTRLEKGAFVALAPGAEVEGRIVPPAVVEDDCHVGAEARVGSLAVLGRGVKVGRRTTIEQAVVLQGAEIGADCHLRYCIVGAGAQVGDNTRIEGGAVLGEGVTVGAGNVLTHGARVFPGVSLPDGAITF
jgi:mannose-1-phosphate guanylyltransferase